MFADFFYKIIIFVQSHSKNIKNISFLVFINLFLSGLSFFTQIKIANTLGKGQFGMLAYGFAIANYGSLFIRYGLDRTMVRDLIHHQNIMSVIIGASLVVRYVLLVLFIFGLLIWKILAVSGDELSWGILMVIISNSLMSLDLQPVYDSLRQINRHAIYNLIQRALYFVLVWSMILVCPEYLSILWIGILTFVSVILYLYLQHRWVQNRLTYIQCGRECVVYAFKILKTNFVVWIASFGAAFLVSFNQIILKKYCGAEELGGYAAAWQIAFVSVLLMAQIARVGNPAMARITRPENTVSQKRHFLVKYVIIMILAVFPIVLACILFPERIFKLLFRPEYLSSAALLPYLGGYFVLYASGWVAVQYLISSNNEKAYLASYIAVGLTSVICCCVFIPSYKGIGAVYSLLISYLLANVINWFQVWKDLRKKRLCTN